MSKINFYELKPKTFISKVSKIGYSDKDIKWIITNIILVNPKYKCFSKEEQSNRVEELNKLSTFDMVKKYEFSLKYYFTEICN